jgi:hypothetical protein
MSEIIGNSKQIKNLEIAEFGFEGEMTWLEANKACNALGDGWRLPTKEELDNLYNHKEDIEGFADMPYWSSTEGNSLPSLTTYFMQFFHNGSQIDLLIEGPAYARAVKTIIN